MTTLLYSHASCIEHNPGEFHPESPDRLRAVMSGLDNEEFEHLEHLEAPIIDVDSIKRVHQSEYVERILDNVPQEGEVHVRLDPDTAMSSASGEAARRAAGAPPPGPVRLGDLMDTASALSGG